MLNYYLIIGCVFALMALMHSAPIIIDCIKEGESFLDVPVMCLMLGLFWPFIIPFVLIHQIDAKK